MSNESIRVLLIEDDIVDQMAFKRLVKKYDLPYEYMIADSVRKTREIAASHHFDIVLTDYNLGDGNAFDVFPLFAGTPVIFVTGGGDELIAVKALKEGARDYLIKDNERSYLAFLPMTVENVLKHARMERFHQQAEEDIRRSEAWNRAILEAVPDLIFVIDKDGTFLSYNKGDSEAFPLDETAIIGSKLDEVFPKDLASRAMRQITNTLESGHVHSLEYELIPPGQTEPQYFEARMSSTGENRVLTLVRDVTEQTKSKNALLKRDEILQALSYSAEKFLKEASWEANIDGILQQFGTATGVNRICIYEYEQLEGGTSRLNRTYLWEETSAEAVCTSHFRLMFDNLGLEQWNQSLSGGKYILCSRDTARDNELRMLQENSLQTLLIIPIFAGTEYWGVIFFCNLHQQRRWSSTEIETLESVADTMGAAILRQQAEAELNLFSMAIEQSSASVVITNPEGEIEYINPKFRDLTGYTNEEVIGQNPRILKTEYHAREYYTQLWDTITSGKTWKGDFLNMKKNGLFFWEMASISPVFNKDNQITHFVAVKEDITDRKEAEEALNYQLRFENIINAISTRFINISTDAIDSAIEKSLEKLGSFIQVDRAYVYLFKQNNQVMSKTHEWCSSGIASEIETLQDIPNEMLSWWSKQLKESDFIAIPSVELMPEDAAAEQLFFQRQHIKSLIALPLEYKNEVIGFLGFDALKMYQSWNVESVSMLRFVGEIIVNALQRKWAEEKFQSLYDSLLKELDLASSVQQYLLPSWVTIDDNIILSQTYTPSSKVGGDLFDIIRITDDVSVVYIADISGHGVQAALIMTAVKSMINMLIDNEKQYGIEPYQIITRLNNILARGLFQDKNYMTILFCVIDFANNTMRYYNAGHPAMMKFNLKTRQASLVESKGSIPVGWMADFIFEKEEEGEIQMEPDTLYMLYTDGIFECEDNTGEQLGLEGLERFIEEKVAAENSIVIPHMIKHTLKSEHYDTTQDDFTLLSFQRRASSQQNRLMLKMQSVLQNTAGIGKQCEEFVKKYIPDEMFGYSVELVVNEFVNNQITHGLQSKSDTIIILEVVVEGNEVCLTFWDRGINWTLPPRESDDDFYARKSLEDDHGRGMQIIFSLSYDVVKHRYDALNETIIRMQHNE